MKFEKGLSVRNPIPGLKWLKYFEETEPLNRVWKNYILGRGQSEVSIYVWDPNQILPTLRWVKCDSGLTR